MIKDINYYIKGWGLIMEKRYIYLVFSKTGTLLSRLITIATDSKYAHSSISLDEDFTRMYSFGRKNPNNPLSAGFVEENIYDGVFKKFIDSKCLIYRIQVTEEQYNLIKSEVNEFLKYKDKYRYNLLGLLGVLINRPLKRDNYYFCSQFVSEILMKSRVFKLNKNPRLIKPCDLLYIDNVEIVYEGYINELYRYNKIYAVN